MCFKLIIFAYVLSIGYSYSINSISPRLIGGHDATSGEVPYQVSLQLGLLPKFPYKHFCGGVMLNEYWVLTAAHCLTDLKNSSYYNNPNITRVFKVKAGKYNLSDVEDSEQTASVEAFFIHENYTGVFKDLVSYDIGLLRLEKPLTLNEKVAYVKLPEQNETLNSIGQISGWGELRKNKMATTLQIETVPVLERLECLDALKIFSEDYIKRQENKTIEEDISNKTDTTENLEEKKGVKIIYLATEDSLCTGPTSNGTSVCSGDSGGPLTTVNKRGEVVLAGIAAWAISPCIIQGAPSGFTKVSYYLDWINKTMTNNIKNKIDKKLIFI